MWTAVLVIPPHTQGTQFCLAVDTRWLTQLLQGKQPYIYAREKSHLQLYLTVSFQQTLKRRRVSKSSSFGLFRVLQ